MDNTLQDLIAGLVQVAANGTAPVTASSSQDISVANTASISEQNIKVIMQGSVKTPSSDTVRQMVANGNTFSQLLTSLFPNAQTGRITRVSLNQTVGGRNSFALNDTMPGALLDAPGELRISYSVESGTNG